MSERFVPGRGVVFLPSTFTWTCGGITGHSDTCDPYTCRRTSDGTPAFLTTTQPTYWRGQQVIVTLPGGGQGRGFVRWQSTGRREVTVRITHAPDTQGVVATDVTLSIDAVAPCDLTLAACLAGLFTNPEESILNVENLRS